MALRTGEETWNDSARFWAKIFGIRFAPGVVTGIPMEFQFSTNWSQFSKSAGGVVGQTLAMERVFSFFSRVFVSWSFYFRRTAAGAVWLSWRTMEELQFRAH